MCGSRGSVISGLVILLALYDGNVERVRAACSRSIDSLSLRSSTKKIYWIIVGLGLVLHSLDTIL
jgi:hypothetical protein